MREMLIALGILVIGFVLLIKGADFFVEGSSSVAKRLRVPSMIIGLTIVAMGTSLPELAVSATASLNNKNALAVSNVIGSNIFNLMVVCGFCALFTPLAVQLDTLKKEFPFSVICAALLLGLGYGGMTLGRLDGLVFVVLFAGYLTWMVVSAQRARAAAVQITTAQNASSQAVAAQAVSSQAVGAEMEGSFEGVVACETGEGDEIKILPVWQCILYIVGGAAAVMYGGDLVVNGASTIAAGLGMSQNLIGLTIVAIGTSLPELVTSIVAARKNEVDMALGNVIGSNIFNILMVLGLASTISPIAFITENMIDIVLLIAMSLLVWAFGWSKQKIERKEGIFMLLIYLAYSVYICWR